jgi:hypothetical protein
MSDHHDEDTTEQPSQEKLDTERVLEARISHVLQTQAAHVHFTTELRNHIIHSLPSLPVRHPPGSRRFLAPALALAALLLSVFALSTYLLLNQQPSIQYTLNQVIAVPAELAHGGQLLSLDPTGQHLVYQPANQPGVMYTANVTNPVVSNLLAMRYAHDVGWSPDGTELVTTVSPAGAPTPLLALVLVGQYMKPLGPGAQAASWSPTSKQQILYITQSANQAQLWTTTPTGQPAQHVATMSVSSPVQSMLWSHDGQKLALLVTQRNTSQPQTQSSLYIMDARTHALSTIVQAGSLAISMVDWSPDKHYLTYEQIDSQGHATLHALDVDQQKELFTLPIQKNLVGYSWSPDSGSLVYSDGGTLHIYTMHGIAVQLPKTNTTQEYPFWLKDGRILFMNITNGEGELAILAQSKK